MAFNTGRPASFVVKVLFPALEKIAESDQDLGHIIALAEKGAVKLQYKHGQITLNPDPKFSITPILELKVVDYLSKAGLKTMAIDSTKKSMMTLEKLLETQQLEFVIEQQRVYLQLSQMLINNRITDYTVDMTTIVIDIEHNKLGKDLGMQKILEWLDEQNIKIDEFITFEDSLSDLEMAQLLHNQNLKVLHVNVGNSIQKNTKYPLVQLPEAFNNGTLKYLSSVN